jgi:hypothetical protein
LGFGLFKVLVVFLLIGTGVSASDSCRILPIESYNANFEVFDDLLFQGEKNLTEIAEVLSLKQQGEYQKMFERMKELASTSNHSYAYYNLGQFYRLGIGTPIDISFAVENYFEAAIRGSEKSIVNLTVILDKAVQDGVTAFPALLVPIDKAYSLYWLLTATTTVDDRAIKKQLEALLAERLTDATYQEILSTNYPNFNTENPYKTLLGQTILFSSSFATTFKPRAPVGLLVKNLNSLTCQLETHLHFYKFNKLGYLSTHRQSLERTLDSTLDVLKKMRPHTTKNKDDYKKYLNSLEKWKQELASFLETTNTL